MYESTHITQNANGKFNLCLVWIMTFDFASLFYT